MDAPSACLFGRGIFDNVITNKFEIVLRWNPREPTLDRIRLYWPAMSQTNSGLYMENLSTRSYTILLAGRELNNERSFYGKFIHVVNCEKYTRQMIRIINTRSWSLLLQYKIFPRTRNKNNDVSLPPIAEMDGPSFSHGVLFELVLDCDLFALVDRIRFKWFCFWNDDRQPVGIKTSIIYASKSGEFWESYMHFGLQCSTNPIDSNRISIPYSVLHQSSK